LKLLSFDESDVPGAIEKMNKNIRFLGSQTEELILARRQTETCQSEQYTSARHLTDKLNTVYAMIGPQPEELQAPTVYHAIVETRGLIEEVEEEVKEKVMSEVVVQFDEFKEEQEKQHISLTEQVAKMFTLLSVSFILVKIFYE
jgi:hypothetical protein